MPEKNLDSSNSFCLIVLSLSFMPWSCVKQGLTCSERDSISRKFLGEHCPFGPSSWPSGVCNQFSHHKWESISQKGGGGGYEHLCRLPSFISHSASLSSCLSLQCFPPPHTSLFSCHFVLLQLIAFSLQPFSAMNSCFLSQKNAFFPSFQLLLGLSL